MSRIDLGFLEDCEDWQVESRLFPSKVGGKPAWLDLQNLPKFEDLKCGKCNEALLFLCQIYAPIEDSDSNFHRTLFVFVCRNAACCERNNSSNIKVFRNSLPRANKFYDFEPPKEEPVESKHDKHHAQLCNLCGCLATKHCSQCKKVAYCSKEHQVLDWKESHKALCQSGAPSSRSKILFDQHELLIEPEELAETTSDEQEQLEVFKKLEAEGKTGTMTDVEESELEAHASTDSDKVFLKFRRRVDENAEQVLRYQKGGEPLWIAAEPLPETIPKCESCGAERQFEFQIMPQLLAFLNETLLDWGVIAVYTCSKSCAGEGYNQEFVFKQDVTLNNL